ncbi:hypothetical protein CJ738_34225, partial [Klebsiella pneumoniae]
MEILISGWSCSCWPPGWYQAPAFRNPYQPARLIGDVLRGVIVAIILWAYGAMGNISILNVITL